MLWQEKKITVMGLGLLGGGVGTAIFFAQRGAKVVVTDLRDAEILRPSIEKLREFPITYVLGGHREQDFVNTELVVRNPGVSDSSPYLVAARKAGVPVETEASLFLRETSAFVIGVTGTKGKTTTSHLIVAGLQACGAKVYLAGIPGASFLATLGELEGEEHAVVVAEFSSWDLESISTHHISPPVAIITNLFPDHLNRHGSMEAYRDAKAVIFDHQKPHDRTVVLGSETFIRERMTKAPGKVVVVSREDVEAIPPLKLSGSHMRRNAALAFAAVRETILHASFPLRDRVYFDAERTKRAFEGFLGAPGRLERVCSFLGRDFINDTAATNPGALVAALEAFELPVILIAGGEDKALPYDQKLAATICQRSKQIILLPGSASEKLNEGLANAGCSDRCRLVANMAEAVSMAWKTSVEGDVILLSPGAASFNLFLNEFERGDAFLAEIKHLAKQ